MTETVRIAPQPGPQTAFLRTSADIGVIGGAAGGGKSMGLLLDGAKRRNLPGFEGLFLRRTYPELTGGGGLWPQSQSIYRELQGVPRDNALDWTFPSGAHLQMVHLQHPGDVYGHQSRQYATLYFDELTQFLESQFWFMLSRLRSTCGVKPYVRASCNPDPDSFVRRLIDWWIGADGFAIPERSGVLRWFVREPDDSLRWTDAPDDPRAMSLTFIPARLDDNPALTSKDPGYRAKLEALPRVERERLLGGNWNVRAAAGTLFRREWYQWLDAPPADARGTRWVRAWDLAATAPSPSSPDPDWTRGAKLGATGRGDFVLADMVSRRGTPGDIEALVRATAIADGRACEVALWQDPGQAGKSQADHLCRVLQGFTVRTRVAAKDKLTYASPVSAAAEHGHLSLVRGPWCDGYLAEAEAFPDARHDDQVDAVSLGHLVLTGDDALAHFTNMARLFHKGSTNEHPISH